MSSSQRIIGTRSKSRDEAEDTKENVENDQESDFRPASPVARTPATPAAAKSSPNAAKSTQKTNRSAASLFSPSPYSSRRLSPSYSERMHSETMKKPDPFPDNWDEAMGTGSGSSSSTSQAPPSASLRRGGNNRREQQQPQDYMYGAAAGMSQVDSNERKMLMWEPRDGRGNNVHREGADNYLTADLGDITAPDDFPAVADCLNLGSFAEEDTPPRRHHRSPKGSPTQQQQHQYEQAAAGLPFSYRSSPPPPQHQQHYPPAGGGGGPPHASPRSQRQYPLSGNGPPPPQQFPPGSGPPLGAPAMYYGGPPAGSPYGYHPPQGPPQGGLYRYPPYQGDPWMSPPAAFPDFAPPPPRGTPPHRSPPPKKRRNADWDSSNGGASSSSSPGEEAGSTTPEKVFPEKQEPMRSPFRSPVPSGEKGSTNKKYKRSPLFQGGTPGIAAYGSWDTPGGTLNAALGDEFSPMGPSFAPFCDESPLQEGGDATTPMPFDAKLDLAAGEEPVPNQPPSIRQRPTGGQPAASPFSAFVGELSPFPPPPPMRGSPVNHDQREYPVRHHPGQPFHRSPEDFPRHPGMPTPSKPSSHGPPGVPPGRPAHPMASPVMSGSAQRQQPWYEHVAPSPGHFRLELGDGKTRKGFEDINSLLRGANGPPPPPQRPSPPIGPPGRFDSSGRPRSASALDLNTPIKAGVGTPGARMPVPGSSGRSASSYHGSARKTPRGSTTPRYTPMAKGRGSAAATPGSKTPSSGGKEGRTPIKQKTRRHPCNCKKSKCLKLYCECFAGELYCDGCNCNDCHNSTAYEAERQKSMKDTRAKNPNAFKERITVKSSSHNMGCRCKKSECLKKYCECFQAGVMCAGKCKCVDCLNYVGSQALIDKRRKMKDHRGAEFAMRIADEAWKGGKPNAPRGLNPRGLKPSPAGSRRGGPPLPMPHMMQPSPSPHHRGPPPPHYMGPMMGHPPMGYSPMGMPPVTPGYVHGKQQMLPGGGGPRPDLAKKEPNADPKKQQSTRTPKTVTPRTPAVRLGFDPHSSKKKRKLSPGAKEPTFPFFGDRPEQPKTTALAIFSYLSNDDLFNSTLVCKQWNKLAMDDELWQF